MPPADHCLGWVEDIGFVTREDAAFLILMKKDDLIILLFFLLLLGAMLITILFGGEKSRHGVGLLPDVNPGLRISTVKIVRLDLGQWHALPGKLV